MLSSHVWIISFYRYCLIQSASALLVCIYFDIKDAQLCINPADSLYQHNVVYNCHSLFPW